VSITDRYPRPGRAALAHLIWEAVLLVLAVLATIVAVVQGHFFSASGMWPQFAVTGLLAAGLALSLRTGTPNLAVASVAALAQLVYVLLVNEDLPPVAAGALAVLAASALGAVLAAITGLTGLPAWAVSLAGIAIANVVGYARGGNITPLHAGFVKPAILDVFAVLFVLGSLAGGVLWLLPPVRALLGPGGDPPDRPVPPPRRLLRALVGLGGSSLLAGLAGVLLAGYTGASGFGGDTTQLLTALAAVLLGGMSLAGRGGGVAGTVLGAYLLSVVAFAAAVHGGPFWLRTALPATVALVLGLFASWVLDRVSVRIPAPPAPVAPAWAPVGPPPAR
jgi:ribose transport system permease protein